MKKEHIVEVSLKEYIDVKVDHIKEISDLNIKHLQDLRVLDQRAVALALETNKERLDHLNENANVKTLDTNV